MELIHTKLLLWLLMGKFGMQIMQLSEEVDCLDEFPQYSVIQ